MVAIQDFLQNLLLSFFSIMRWLILAKRPYKCMVSDKAVIIGNGPSAKEYLNNWQREENTDYWAVNFFAQSQVFFDIKPEHYIMVDPVLWKENVAEKTLNRRAHLYSELNKVDWLLTLWVPKKAIPYLNRDFISNAHVSIKVFNENAVEGFTWLKHLFIKKGLAVPRPRNVLIPAIAKCIHLNYKAIDLIGTDHDWLKDIVVDEENRIWMVDRHFYDKNDVDKEQLKIRIKKPGNEFFDFSELLFNYYHVFEGYKLLNAIAKHNNISIINRTKHSFIDAFVKK